MHPSWSLLRCLAKHSHILNFGSSENILSRLKVSLLILVAHRVSWWKDISESSFARGTGKYSYRRARNVPSLPDALKSVSAMIKDIFTFRVEQGVLKYASFNPEEWKDAGFIKVSEPVAATMGAYTR